MKQPYKEPGYHILDVYWACKGKCDRRAKAKYGNGVGTKWQDLSNFRVPNFYLFWIIGYMNEIGKGTEIYEDRAYEHLRDALIAIAQTVFRKSTREEWKQVELLEQLPLIAGGLPT